jgi:hypothetical protein
MSIGEGGTSTPCKFLLAFPYTGMEMGGNINGFYHNFPKSEKQHDSIMVVVDKLSKYPHFIPGKSTYKVAYIS